MPQITFHKNGQTFQGEVKTGANLVVRAGIKQFPYPHLAYQCGMGKCATCACKVLAGAEHLPAPNWKEKKQLGAHLDQGFRLVCQLWPEQDLELEQVPLPATNAGAASATQPVGTAPATPAA
ncbi:2Fe-2S iron-sulfur cluster-binding protein [Comamonas sp. JNW]|uniref:2Fe-2S iron-sulfur cluster-binding protein n=1 Tax=unclassified Comamonas TaxID=2638500 RepID=UPI000DE625BD|nr:2Fe-2S iron-sulfur cluster-binding protein [Comamonas sp. JNW]PWB14988.1 ferredoxin [Comamonas sp. JNW]